jgi:hypothetical protein
MGNFNFAIFPKPNASYSEAGFNDPNSKDSALKHREEDRIIRIPSKSVEKRNKKNNSGWKRIMKSILNKNHLVFYFTILACFILYDKKKYIYINSCTA